MESLNPLIAWPCKVTWHVKSVIYPLWPPWPRNLASWWLMVRWMHAWSYMSFFLQKMYGHQTWQGADVWRGKFHNEVGWFPDQVISRGHFSNWKFNISSTKPMIIKFGRVVTYGDRKPRVESHDPLITLWLQFKT